MPRLERRLEAGDDVLLRFAADLRTLRKKAGNSTYRELARRAHYSAGTLSDAAGGRKLPTLAVTLAYVQACDGDVDDWEQRWHAVAAELAGDRPGSSDHDVLAGPAPYVGLAAFQRDDVDRFFGRDRLLRQVHAKMAAHRFLAIVGSSGAGKSSLLHAGLLPRLDQVSSTVVFTPGTHPLEECAVHVAALVGATPATILNELNDDPRNLHRLIRQAQAAHARDTDVILVIDQFEEVFTLCEDPEERDRFLAALLTASAAKAGQTRVVVAMRADFYARCADYPDLAAAVAEAQVLVGPLTSGQLREVIVQPAVGVGSSVEGALVAELVGEASGRPGVLPLLSHVLLETWRRRRGNTLTVNGYHAAGGIRGALAQTAERTYLGFDTEQQQAVQRLFLRLIALGDGTEDTKRRVRCDELDVDPGIGTVLDGLAAARLITLDADTVEVTHEALIHAWPRLRGWLDEDRDGLRVHRQVTEATAGWEAVDRDPGALARGTRLAIALVWARQRERVLTMREKEFLQASDDAEQHERRVTRRRTRQLRGLSIGLAVLLAGAVALAGVAVVNQQTATEQRRIAESGQFAAQAGAAAGQDAGTAARLSLQAISAYPTAEARSSLFSVAGRPVSHGLLPAARLGTDVGPLSPDGHWLATQDAGNQAVIVWDVPQRKQIAILRADSPTTSLPMAAAFNSDGRRLMVATSDNMLQLWDPAAPQHPLANVASTIRVQAMAFSPNGTRVATIANTQALEIRDSATLQLVNTAPSAETEPLSRSSSVAYSPDGRTLATTGGDNQVLLRDAATGAVETTLPSSPSSPRPLAFSPDGTRLAFADQANGITIWDIASHRQVTTVRDTGGNVNGLAFEPRTGDLIVSSGNGLHLFDHELISSVRLAPGPTAGAASANGTIITEGTAGTLVWDVTRLPIKAFDPLEDIVFAAGDAAVLGAGGHSAALRWWGTDAPHTQNDLIKTPSGSVASYRLSRDGTKMAAKLTTGNIVIHDAATGTRLTELASPTGNPAGNLAFSPDGRYLAAGYGSTSGPPGVPHTLVWDVAGYRAITDLPVNARNTAFDPRGGRLTVDDRHSLTIWNIATETRIAELPHYPGLLLTLAYSPDGRLLAASGPDGTISIWDTDQSEHLADLTGHAGAVQALAFSPDGRFLATGGEDAKLIIWDITTRNAWAALTGTSGYISALAWNHTGTTLATSSSDGILSLWPVDIPTATHQVCQTLTTNFPTQQPLDACDAPR